MQLMSEMKQINFIPANIQSSNDYRINTFRNSWPMIQAAIIAGCYPGIGVIKDGLKIKKIRTKQENN